MPRKKHLIVDSGCTQDNERWSLSACGLNEDSDVEWDGTRDRESVSCKRCQAQMAKPRKASEPFQEERPILFNGAMIRSILSGQKTVTRRPIKGRQVPSRSESDSPEHQWIAVVQDHPRWGFAVFGATEEKCAAELAIYGACPYGRRGDRLWVRESFNSSANCRPPIDDPFIYAADLNSDGFQKWSARWKPSIHMPRAACRILLEITDVRVERLQGISPAQITAEGVSTRGEAMWGSRWWIDAPEQAIEDARKGFADLWTATGGDWGANPWVWAVEFKRIEQ